MKLFGRTTLATSVQVALMSTAFGYSATTFAEEAKE